MLNRDLASIQDFSPAELQAVLDLAALVKARPADFRDALQGKQVVLFFEKPSLRTRLTFEAGIASLGGASFFVDQTRSRLDEREPLSDIAHNLERWVHAVVLRTFAHGTVTGMAEHASIPVVNALSDLEHPCQALADYLTLQERFGDLKKIRLAYVGDGNNVAHSLMLTAASLGSSISIATPKGYGPNPEVVVAALAIASATGAQIEITNDPVLAVTGADAIYTDVWASMGQEDEAGERARIFAPFQVNDKLMSHADDAAFFMHCLPAHRGDEVTASVIDSPRSIVFDQAENRLHVQKAILLLLLGSGTRRAPRSMNA
ncbi:MAG TPA: ornithine carbamoyltransferase [Terriglobales bacterium]|nr:ornithine carbamoyltransferase [Terriglobales bacterium]